MMNDGFGGNDEVLALTKAQDEAMGRNFIAALGLCWVFGMFGGHRFYTGKTGTGVAQLILALTIVGMPIAYLWAIIDGLMIVFGAFKSEYGEWVEKNLIFAGLYVVFLLWNILMLLLNLTSLIRAK